MNQGKPINLTKEQRIELERRVRSQTLDARSVRRARIVLLAADGVGNHEIARRLEISRNQVIAWRGRFAKGGIAAIEPAVECRDDHGDNARVIESESWH